jgi:hypothetical protein
MTTPNAETRQRERLPTEIHPSADAACRQLAAELAALIRERSAAGRHTVLGLATGSTPVRLYRELIRQHREEGLSRELKNDQYELVDLRDSLYTYKFFTGALSISCGILFIVILTLL